MTKNRLRQITAALGLVLAGSAWADGLTEELADQFHTVFRQTVSDKHLTGAAYAVVTPDRIIRIGTAGHTDTRRTQPINENTAFRVASVSKTFAAGLAAVLVEEGEFAWRDRVVDYLPDFRVAGDASQVRIEHLLGQSTGLVPHAYDNLIEDGVPVERIRKQFSRLEFLCRPGDCYSYQNSIFSLIEPVIEKTTKRGYAQLMNEKIFEPLDMRDASVGYEPFVNNPNHAKPHVKSRGQWRTVKVKPNYYRVAPAAGVNASALDMGKWLMAQMGSNPEVLAPRVVDTMTAPRVYTAKDKRRKYWRDLISDAHYGLGWRIYRIGDEQIAYHSGWVSGFRADIAWSETHQVGLAVLMNVESSEISALSTAFWQMAFEKLPSTTESDRVAALAAPP
ncbi:MAG: beta-lactamase family protein [Xanthomonadales bacterium]|nr:beta-lactamase family protein [Gammaproteobacteria bacterium]NNL05077.1 beta-lactamase family protein [Xanthomonadales bacterium]